MLRRAALFLLTLLIDGEVLAAEARLVSYGLPGWFNIVAPEDWRLYTDQASGHIALAGPDGRGVHIWMIVVPKVLDGVAAGSLLAGLSAQVSEDTRWSPPTLGRSAGRITISAAGRQGDVVRVAGLSLVQVDNTTVALYTLASAPAARFAESRDLFASVFASFKPIGNAGGASAPTALSYLPWRDPVEGAFSLEVPKGWQVNGGTFHNTAVDVRQVIQLVNSDGTILIQAGDAEVPPFVEPWGFLQEGQYNGPLLAKHYAPGADFGREYLAWRLQPRMTDLAIDSARAVPELQRMIQSVVGNTRRVDAGEIFFHGTWNGHSARGYLYTATSLIAQGDTVLWLAGDLSSLLGFIASDDQMPAALEAINHMRATFKMNPEWLQRQYGTVAAVSRITTETNNYISEVITKAYAAREASYDTIADQFAKYQRDVLDVSDPQTRQTYQVQAGANYYWIDDRGLILGTHSPISPDPAWFREMLKVEQ